jgi:dGTPase
LPPAEAAALASLRAFNYERIYVRPASLAQSAAVVEVLQALVELYAERPQLLPEGYETGTGTDEVVRAAVRYVAGMTDRYAFRTAITELDWDADRLPRGLDQTR